jgi:hypothetical protein
LYQPIDTREHHDVSSLLDPGFLFGPPLVVAGGLAIAALVLGVRRSRTLTFDEGRYPGLAALRRATLRARYVGIVAGVVVFLVVAGLGRFSQGLFVAPAAAGAVMIAAVLIGQRLTYTRARTAGVAGLERRVVGDYLPIRLAVTAAGLLLVLAVVGVWTTAVATPDDSGLARAFTQSCPTQAWDGQGPSDHTEVHISTPFPGGYYTPGMAAGIVAVVALAWVGVVATTRRPRNGADPELVRVDDALRRQTVEGIVAALGLVTAATLAGVSYAAALAVGAKACTDAYGLGSWALAAVALVGLALALRCSVIVLVPGNGSGNES